MTKESVELALNNAGYGLIGPLEALSSQQISKQINTNLIGAACLLSMVVAIKTQITDFNFLKLIHLSVD